MVFFFLSDLWYVKNPLGIKEFGLHLRRLREAQEYSQQELADLSDLAKKTITRIENGSSAATNDVMISLSRALNISLKELVDFPLPKENSKKKA
jgi:transcriptional regulator with XRE-family HTH domain